MTYNSIFLDSLPFIDKSWKGFLTSEIVQEIKLIEKSVCDTDKIFTPHAQSVFKFLSLSLDKVKVIILGQDPYPQEGVATGRAFEVGTLRSWNEKFSNISLKNIVRAIYFAEKKEYLKYSEIKTEINNGFLISPPDKLFVQWEKQGVLLLNTSFTCEVGKSNSHEKLWRNFTLSLLKYIAAYNSSIIWFLWGNNAKQIVKGIEIKNKIESMHPMMCYNKQDRNDDFLFGQVNPFLETKGIINWLG